MKNDTEPKENNCKIVFGCTNQNGCDHYWEKQAGIGCACRELSCCSNAVAQVNALTIRLQELTGKKVGLG